MSAKHPNRKAPRGGGSGTSSAGSNRGSPRGPGSTRPAQKKPVAKAAPSKTAPAAPTQPRLGVEVDGTEVGEAEAREIWTAFSSYMDVNEGDFAGFARTKGFAEARPEHRAGRAILVLRR